MAVNLSPVGGVAAQFFNNDGVPLAGGLIYTYAAGTSTPAATYTSASGSIAHSNPIVLDSAGRVPTGEIWLTDGVSYKFVLKDSTGILIATYDNIVGINSNFVNYTNSQEIQTATAGQTVFTLNTMNYQPGTNSLSVFVDGVNQYGPGAQYAFVETSGTSVTFASGLHVGASVKFTTSAINASSYGDASQISYMPDIVTALASNVQEKLQQMVNVLDFIPNGTNTATTDCTTYIQNAFDNVPLGTTLYFPPQTFKVTPKTSTYCLNISRNINLMGSQGGKTVIYAHDTNAGHSVLRYAITDNGGFGDVRNPLIHGIGLGFVTTGKHGLFIDQGTVGPINLQITSCNLSGGSAGKALYFNEVTQFTSVFFNQIEGGVEFYGASGDGQRICYNNIFGDKVGISFQTGNGTYSHIIQSNSITCRDGSITIPYSAQVKICYNQLEQVGVNAGGYNSMLVIEDGFGIDVIGNNFGGGANVNQNVTIVAATQVVFRDNVFIRSAAYDFNFTSTSSYNRVEYNRFNGNRTGLNPFFPATIANTGTGNIFPGSGICYFAATPILTSDPNALDAYNESTYSPALSLNGGSVTVAYASRIGQFQQVGNRVNFSVYINTSTWTHTGTAEELLLTLPVTPATGVTQRIAMTGSLNFTKAGYTQVVPIYASALYANGVYFAAIGSGQAWDAIKASNVPSGTQLTVVVSGTYLVDGG